MLDTRCMYLADAPAAKVFRGTLPPGRDGTRATLAIMRSLARDGSRDPALRVRVMSILNGARVASHDLVGEAAALFQFVRDRVRFVNDPADVEWLQDPAATLRVMAGDCDDRATLLAAMLLSIGHAPEFRVIGTGDSEFSHVYVVDVINGAELALDPTYSDNPIGWQYAQPSVMGDYPLCT